MHMCIRYIFERDSKMVTGHQYVHGKERKGKEKWEPIVVKWHVNAFFFLFLCLWHQLICKHAYLVV